MNIDMSLEEIAAKKASERSKNKAVTKAKSVPAKASREGRGKATNGRGKTRTQTLTRTIKQNTKPLAPKKKVNSKVKRGNTVFTTTFGGVSKGNIMSRIQGLAKSTSMDPKGTKLFISNLGPDVVEDNLHELFSRENAKINGVFLQKGPSGQSYGSATIFFERRSDAVRIKEKYAGASLDNLEMFMSIAGEDAPVASAPAPAKERGGLFGSALNDRGDSRNRPSNTRKDTWARNDRGKVGHNGRDRRSDRRSAPGGRQKETPEDVDAAMEKYMANRGV